MDSKFSKCIWAYAFSSTLLCLFHIYKLILYALLSSSNTEICMLDELKTENWLMVWMWAFLKDRSRIAYSCSGTSSKWHNPVQGKLGKSTGECFNCWFVFALFNMWCLKVSKQERNRKAEHGNTTVDHQISFMSILTEWVETAALFMCGQQISLSVQSRRHFDWLCED